MSETPSLRPPDVLATAIRALACVGVVALGAVGALANAWIGFVFLLIVFAVIVWSIVHLAMASIGRGEKESLMTQVAEEGKTEKTEILL